MGNNTDWESGEDILEEQEDGGIIETDEEGGLWKHHVMSIDPGQKPIRIDAFLSLMIKNLSRSRIKAWAKDGTLLVNGETVKVSYKVRPGDEIVFIRPYAPRPDMFPEDIPLDIVYEDDSFLIVNKKPGMVVHPGVGHRSGTLMHALLHYCGLESLPKVDEEDMYALRPGLVHRIDKDTSGLLVISKNEFAATKISSQFFHKTTHRIYNALVWGNVEEDEGTIEGNIGRSQTDRKLFVVYPYGDKGKHAVTHFKVLERFGFATLVECKLETGRTHQIRVHFKYKGHTLFADSFYGGDKILRGLRTQKFDQFIRNCLTIMPRQALHARTLGFVHPKTGEEVHFESELPEDFSGVLDKMRRYVAAKNAKLS